MRLSETVGLTGSAVDLDGQVVEVAGTGGRTRAVGFGVRSVAALGRLLRVRPRHAHAEETQLWLGVRGRLSDPAGRRCSIGERLQRIGGCSHPRCWPAIDEWTWRPAATGPD